jgi:hypothetical protein
MESKQNLKKFKKFWLTLFLSLAPLASIAIWETREVVTITQGYVLFILGVITALFVVERLGEDKDCK